ncbi:MAG: glycosyltransferase [Thomasclavelia ramosa]|uniref:glycosyltransferase n=1 Tax=Amedibacterium intestinale TaxID=2583452 RepID=UPI0013746E39|nr:glycosyltransferase [Amedibacterium intestinale]BBK63237.1 glycosyl transferase family 1 [Amedibacterium intestinale]
MGNKKTVLITTTTPYMIKSFLMNDIRILKELGYKVEVATNFKTFDVISEDELNKFKKLLDNESITINQINFTRRIIDLKSIIKSYKEMKKLLNKKKYTLIHTHTPIAGLITRISYKNSEIYKDSKMIYTAHGFHFFEGNSFIKNFIFKSIEKYGARFTDVLITINKEDYTAAKKFKLKQGGKVVYVPGVGIDTERIGLITGKRDELIRKLHIPKESKLLLSVGELNDNKNHISVIKALPYLDKKYHYLICGVGKLQQEIIDTARNLGVEDRLHLLGYRSDVISVMKSCDIFVFPSKREGLSVALMEAMACDLPCLVSDIRGNNDLIENGKGGFVLPVNLFTESLIDKVDIKIKKGFNKNKSLYFDKKNIMEIMKKIYIDY